MGDMKLTGNHGFKNTGKLQDAMNNDLVKFVGGKREEEIFGGENGLKAGAKKKDVVDKMMEIGYSKDIANACWEALNVNSKGKSKNKIDEDEYQEIIVMFGSDINGEEDDELSKITLGSLHTHLTHTRTVKDSDDDDDVKTDKTSKKNNKKANKNKKTDSKSDKKADKKESAEKTAKAMEKTGLLSFTKDVRQENIFGGKDGLKKGAKKKDVLKRFKELGFSNKIARACWNILNVNSKGKSKNKIDAKEYKKIMKIFGSDVNGEEGKEKNNITLGSFYTHMTNI